MKIGYVSAAQIPSKAANSGQTVRTCAAMAGLGHGVTLIARAPNELRDTIWNTYALPPSFELVQLAQRGVRGLHTAAFLKDARAELRRIRPNLVISRDLFALASIAHWNVPMLYEAHQPPVYGALGANLFGWLARQKNFVRLVTVSGALAEEYQRRYPSLNKKDVVIVPDAADDILQQSESARNIDWPGRMDALQVGYVGHLYDGRGVDFILDAADHFPAMDFHIVGGTDHDIARWKAVGSRPNVVFHGYQQPRDLPMFYRHFDVVVAPFHDEVLTAGGRNTAAFMSPMKIFEYMASGRAMVTSDLPVLREVLSNDRNAVLYAPGDAASWRGALARLANDRELRVRIGAAARSDFLQQYTWTARAKALLAGLDHTSEKPLQ